MPPPPDVSAGPIEDEIRELDRKIQSGQAGSGDVQRYDDLIQTLQDQGSLTPVTQVGLKKVRFRLPPQTALMIESGFGGLSTQAVTTRMISQSTCSEFKNTYYDCADLPWDATDNWTRADEDGDISIRQCLPDDACVSDGVLVIDGTADSAFYRIEEGLVTERFASLSFRMRQTITERNPEPGGYLFGGGIVWLDDGVKSTAVGFAEDYEGNKFVIVPIVGRPDPETGELNVTEVVAAYHDWAEWREYRLVRDAGGMIELLVDDDPVPVVSYPYEALDMGTLGGPAVIFGTLIDGANSRVTFELDYLNYSVGMPSNDGCTSADGKMHLVSLTNINKVFDPNYESNDVVGVVRVKSVDGLGSNTQSHTFFIRSTRTIKDSDGITVTVARDNLKIGPAGSGKSPAELVALATSIWDGRNSSGQVVQFGPYSYSLSIEVVRVDKKQNEKTITALGATGTTTVNDVCGGNGYRKWVWNPTLRRYVAAGCTCYTGYVERGLICTIPFDYDGTFTYNYNFLGSTLSNPRQLFRTNKTPWAGHWWPALQDSINFLPYGASGSPAQKYQRAYGSSDLNGRQVPDAVSMDFGIASCQLGGCTGNTGICDSFSNASIFEAEPRHTVTIGNESFTIDDIKALGSLLYTTRYTFAFEGKWPGPAVAPGLFHTIVTNMIGTKGQAFRIDLAGGNNHPLFAYKVLYRNPIGWHANGAPARVIVVTKVYLVDYNAFPPDNRITSGIIDGSVYRVPNTNEWEFGNSGYHSTREYHYELLVDEKGIVQREGTWLGDYPSSVERSKRLPLPPPDTIVSGIRWRHVLQLFELAR
ncbi:MAG: hypothetical protein HY897_12050 [Deltaproteobacteria bacterium]|nr:hypothetical protein [Deltaproteobacteria bacterium]